MCQAPTMKTNSMSTAMVWLLRHIKYNICIVIFEKKCMYGFSNKITLCDRVNYLFPRLFYPNSCDVKSTIPLSLSCKERQAVVKIYTRPVLGMISNCYGKQLRRECRSILVHSEAMWYKSKCCLWFWYGMKTSANLFIR